MKELGREIKEGRSDCLTRFKRSEASNLHAEVFLEELQYVLNEEVLEKLVVHPQGMNPRVKGGDILFLERGYVYGMGETLELGLARNSLYHELPEFLFHPLSLHEPGMSPQELVTAIKRNKEQTEASKRFFVPFDTAFFRERVKIHQRYLRLFSRKDKDGALSHLVDAIVEHPELQLTAHERYKLFLCLLTAERYKEDLERISELLSIVLGLKVELSLIPHCITECPYDALGGMTLGYSSGISGDFFAELDDLSLRIVYQDEIPEYTHVRRDLSNITAILGFVLHSGRGIHTSYTKTGNDSLQLGDRRLGYDTQL